MIFVDTSAFYAVLDRDDQVHAAAQSIWSRLLLTAQRSPLLTSNYILVECLALLQTRLGIAAVRLFHDDVLPMIRLEWISPAEHMAAVQAVMAANRRGLSVVDCTSFALMRRLGLQQAFCFDGHFVEQGFSPLTSEHA